MRPNGVLEVTVVAKGKVYLASTRSRHPSVDGDCVLRLSTTAAPIS